MCYIWATCVKQATIRNSLTSHGDESRRKLPTAEELQLVVLIRRLLDAVLRFQSSATHTIRARLIVAVTLEVVEDAAEVR